MKKILHPCILLLLFYALPVSAQTIDSVYLTQTFQGSGMPAQWHQTTLASDSGWKFGINTQLQSTYFVPPAHTKFACTNDDACNCDKSNDRLITDTLDLTSAASAVVKFDYYYLNNQEQAMLEVSLDSGVTWLTAEFLNGTLGTWQTHQTDISIAAGHAGVLVAFRYNDLGTFGYGLAIDNVVIYRPAGTDAAMTKVIPAPFSFPSYGTVGADITIGGTISNFTANRITHFPVKWSDGTNTYSYTFLDTVPIAGQGDFTHSQSYHIAATGPHPLKVWIELPGDTATANDTLNTTITGVLFAPARKVVIEDHTECSTPNGYYSSRGIVWKDSFARSGMAQGAEIISVHAEADPMKNTVYALGAASSSLGVAWPQLHIDRKAATDPIYIFDQYDQHAPDFGVADISLSHTYDTTTRMLDVSADVHFAIATSPATAQYRLALVLTEDSVHSEDSAYRQNNGAYTNNALGPLSGAGIDFAAQPYYVPASMMYYMNVARYIGGSYWGTAGSLASTIAEGSTQIYSFPSYTVPAGYNAQKMRVIVLLINASDSVIVNANGEWITPQVTAIEQLVDNANAVKISPNPFTGQTNLVFKLDRAENVSMRITNLLGDVVSELPTETIASGDHTITINGNGLPEGVYLVTLKAGSTTVTKRVILNK